MMRFVTRNDFGCHFNLSDFHAARHPSRISVPLSFILPTRRHCGMGLRRSNGRRRRRRRRHRVSFGRCSMERRRGWPGTAAAAAALAAAAAAASAAASRHDKALRN